MRIHQNHSFFSKTSRRNRFIVRPFGAKVHASCGASSAGKGSCPLAGRFAMLRKTGRFLGEARRGPRPLLLSIVSTGFAGRAGRFFEASAQKNQFRVSKTRAGREFVRLESPHGRFQHCFITSMMNSNARPAVSRRMCSSLPWIVCRSSAVRSIAEKR